MKPRAAVLSLLLLLTLVFASAPRAFGGAVVTYGSTSLGVNDQGHLNFNGFGPGGSMTYGVFRAGVGDAIAPGCFCEGWGVAVTLPGGGDASGWASVDNGGIGGLTATGTFGSVGGVTATSTVHLQGAPLSVTHSFGPSLAPDVFQVQVAIENTGDFLLQDLVYRRAMDWDVPPTEFDELVTHQDIEANLESAGGRVRYASDDGFAWVDPLNGPSYITAGSVNQDFTFLGPDDHGSLFDFAFGDLDAGATRIFNIFYGSASTTPEAYSRLAQIGIADSSGNPLPGGLYSLGNNSDTDPEIGSPAAFLFAFGGVGAIETGTSPSVPILPFSPAPDTFVFDNPAPRRWYDPPFVYGFEISAAGGGFGGFTEVEGPPGFDPVEIWDFVGGTKLGTTESGTPFLFSTPLSSFVVSGIAPLLDMGDPGFATAFPLFLDWAGTADSMTWSALVAPTGVVPEPGTWSLLAGGLLAGWFVRRRKGTIR